MRATVAFAVLAIATPAAADSFVDLSGGISIPVGDDDWTELVESSPKLAVRVGAFPKELGGYLQADWSPVNTNAQGWDLGGLGNADISAHRFRVTGGVLFHHNVSNTLVVTGRGGIGADIAYVGVSGTVLGQSFDESETDAGLGFEFAGGVFFKLGNLEVGGELALPFAIHDDDNPEPAADFVYTSYDIDLMFVARFLSR
jgi:hypothetical protein